MTTIHDARGAVRAAVRAIQDVREGHFEPVQSQVRAVVQALAARQATAGSPKAFRGELAELGCSKPQATRLLKILAIRRDIVTAALTVLATVPEKRATTERLYEALGDHIASVWCQTLVAPKPFVRSLPRFLDRENEFGLLMTWLDLAHTAPNIRVHALGQMLVYVRSGHATHDIALELARGGQLDEAAQAVEKQLDDILVRVRVSPFGAPLAHRASPSNYGARSDDEEDNVDPDEPLQIDAVVRDAENPRRVHVAVCSSVPDQGNAWPSKVASALRNSMKLGLDPFETDDGVGSLSYLSMSWLYGKPTSAGADWSDLESLPVIAMVGAQSINPLEMEPLGALRFDHHVIGGRSSAVGGMALSPQELIERAARQWVGAIQAMRHWPREELPPMLDDACHGLVVRYPSWSKPILMDAREDLAAMDDPDGTLVGDVALSRLTDPGRGGTATLPREVKPPEPHHVDTVLERMHRDRVFEELQQARGWDAATERRMAFARDHISTPIWNEMVRAHRER